MIARLGRKASLVISHASGDEGYTYERYLIQYARRLGVRLNCVSEIVGEQRARLPDGRKVYALWDIYPHADLVTYPSDIEGFGNAFLEAVYFRRPILVNNYLIYSIDIKPKGFKAIEFDGFIADETVEATRRILDNPHLRQEMVENNYCLAQRHYSYAVLEHHLRTLLVECFGEEWE